MSQKRINPDPTYPRPPASPNPPRGHTPPYTIPPPSTVRYENWFPPRPLPPTPQVPMQDRITAAEKQIAAILAQLENDTGTLVEDIDIRSLECTRMMDTRQIFHRRVVIECKPIPGSMWDMNDAVHKK